jgi:glycosyltransferase involved in cell wall biosynthesis
MRIACLSTSTVPSRTANSLQLLKVCQSFVALGHEVKLWLPGRMPDVTWDDLAQRYGIQYRFPIQWIRTRPQLRRYDYGIMAAWRARRWRPDLYYSWSYQAAAITSRLGWPTALEVHDRQTGRFGPRLFSLFVKSPGAVRVLPTTQALLRWLEKKYGVDLAPPLGVVSPNGVDLERYTDLPPAEEARTALDLPQRFTAVYTGHLYQGRGIDMILELAKRNRSSSFVIAGGESPAVSTWRDKTNAAGLDNVRFLGFVPNQDLPIVQAAADVLLMPHELRVIDSSGSDIAPFTNPMKAYEYMAVGKPILASELPIIGELLNDDMAILIEPEDMEAWDQAFKRVQQNESLRKRLGEAAREHVKQYTWQARSERILTGLSD